ncbi:MAG: sigma-70 family RNA polymerase sigma factor [Agriterribacter sp.]
MTPIDDDLQRFYGLHRTYYDHLIHIGLRFGWNREDLKDIINQMFLDMIDQGIQVNSIINPKAYLSTTFRRKLIDIVRSNNRKKEAQDFLMQEEEYESGTDEIIEQEQQKREMVKKIKAIYDKLPPRCKKVIFLKFYEGLTTDQIAEKTGLSSRSVYNNLFEALKLLRADLAQVHFAGSISLFSLLFLIISNL